MIDNVIKTLKLMRYGYQAKLCLFGGVGSFLLGVFMKVAGLVGSAYDTLLFSMLPMFLCQLFYGLDYVKMISSSDRKRWLTVYMPELLTDVTVLLGLVLYYVLTELRPSYPEEFLLNVDGNSPTLSTGNIMFCAGLMAFIIMCYVSACFKRYWTATIIFVVLMILYGIANTLLLNPVFEPVIHFTKWQGILAAALFYLAGVFVGGAVRRLLYKVPVSVMSIGKRIDAEK